MYIENAKVHATFFKNDAKDTDKTISGSLSVSVKVGETDGKDEYENDYYKVYFVGNAYEKAKSLEDKQRVVLNKMRIRNRYVKEKGKNYVSITVFDFELMETGRNENQDAK